MDVRGRARYARAIAQVARTLEQEGIKMWLGGDWAQRALEEDYAQFSREAQCYIFAVDATDTRRILEELGYDVVHTTATVFSTERGSWRIDWQLLWHDERGQTVSYDEQDKPRVWPDNAFPEEPRGIIFNTSVYVADLAVQSQVSNSYPNPHRRTSRKKEDVDRVKAIMHDRM